jgi:putative copper resistance protein D
MWALCCSLVVLLLGLDSALLFAQHGESGHEAAAVGSSDHGHDHHALSLSPDSWEGSKAGVAYSEFNHHLAGLFVLLIGFSEMAQALRSFSLGWARMLLPMALLGMAAFLLIWSDHQAWPIGPLSFAETFFGNDHEILQHKIYGFLALTVGLIELYRRLDRLTHVSWLVPLPLFAMIGGIMLFAHSHGAHPAAQKIAMHHAVMGTLAVSAGSSKLASAWRGVFMGWSRSRWETIWAGLILLIGLQLLFYSE